MSAPRLSGWRLLLVAWLLELPGLGPLLCRRAAEELMRKGDVPR